MERKQKAEQPAPPPKRALQNGVKTLLKTAVSLALLAYLVLAYDWRQVWTQLSALPGWGVLFLAALFFATQFSGACKWRVLYPHAGVLRLYETVLVSHFYATVLPGQLFGEAAKVLYLLPKSGEKRPLQGEQLAASVVVDKITGLVALLLLGGMGLLMSAERDRFSALFPAFGALLLGLPLLLFSLRLAPVRRLLEKGLSFAGSKGPRLLKWSGKLRAFLDAWTGFLRSPKRLAASLLMGIVYQGMIVLVNGWAGALLGVELSLWDWSWVCAFISLVLLLPFTIGGLGLREGGYIGALGLLGVASESALAVSLLIFALQLLTAALGGVILLLRSLTARRT